MSRNATVRALSRTWRAGISPAAMPQNRQSATAPILSCGRLMLVPTYMVALLRTSAHHPSGAWLARCPWPWGVPAAVAPRAARTLGMGGNAIVEPNPHASGGSREADMTVGEPGDVATRPMHVTEIMVADNALVSIPAEWDADRAVTALYAEHYRSLVRLAVLLVRDMATAEEVVQESFVAAAVSGQPVTFCVAAPRCRGPERAETGAGYAECRAGSDRAARALGGSRCAPDASLTAARGARAALLRRPVRGPDSYHDGHQPGRRQEPHGAGHVRAAGRAGA